MSGRKRTGRMKPCKQCGGLFWCEPCMDIGAERERVFCGKPCYHAHRSEPQRRFWEKVDRKGPNDCWLWTAAKFKKTDRQMGYGRFDGSGPFTYAHRSAWILTNGPIPDGKLVMHTCDVPLCCNPAHLKLGTHEDNMRDMHAKGRYMMGRRGRELVSELD